VLPRLLQGAGGVYTIAIHPDEFVHANGEHQSFSTRWSQLAAGAGIRTRQVDAYAPDFFRQLEGCDAFMWRFDFGAPERLFAKRLLSAVEHTGIPVFPSWRTAWHFEDKVAQRYLLEAAGVPTPRTWVFWSRAAAMDFIRTATYPLVIKFASGFRSANVRMLHTSDEAVYWIDKLFGAGAFSLDERPPASPLRAGLRRVRSALRALRGRSLADPGPGDEWQQGYVYLQEYLPGNLFDTRVTVIGDRAFAYRRLNRPGDFRASGSGRFEWNPDDIDLETVRMAFRTARTLDAQCVAIDGLRRGREPVVGEISYTFASWCVRECPGHWTLRGDSASAPLTWVPGKLAPENAIFQDFLSALSRRGVVHHAIAN
jgi:glutathione synthase/RimK-type ligase-like ATP-grasp enzyme